MKALIIGGSGYLGRSLSQALLRRGVEIILCQHKTAPKPSEYGSIRTIKVSLKDIDELDRILDTERPDVVIHLASGLIPASSMQDYREERRTVIEPTFLLLPLLADRSIPIVFFSSGGAIYGTIGGHSATERDACQPISFYGHAKLEIEELIQFFGRTVSLPYLILRPSNPFGGSQSTTGRQGLIAAILGRVQQGKPIPIWGDGRVIRDYIYIDDLCRAVTHLIEYGARGIVNVGSGIGHSTMDVLSVVETVIQRAIPLDFQPARSVDVPRLVLDVSHSSSLGVAPARSLTEGVRLFAAELGLTDD